MTLPYVSSMLCIPSESLGREGTDDRTSTSNQFDMHNPDMLVMATEVLVFMAVEGNLSSRMLVRTAPLYGLLVHVYLGSTMISKFSDGRWDSGASWSKGSALKLTMATLVMHRCTSNVQDLLLVEKIKNECVLAVECIMKQ